MKECLLAPRKSLKLILGPTLAEEIKISVRNQSHLNILSTQFIINPRERLKWSFGKKCANLLMRFFPFYRIRNRKSPSVMFVLCFRIKITHPTTNLTQDLHISEVCPKTIIIMAITFCNVSSIIWWNESLTRLRLYDHLPTSPAP
jgi:hypothetical protein